MMKEKILIVEDQFIEANNLQLILQRAGYVVTGIARSVSSALRLIEQEKPHMVLLDIYLQGPMTGIELARILNHQKIAFVYLSANSDRQNLQQAKATRPYGFLVKPFREKDVLVALEIAWYMHKNSPEAMMSEAAKNDNALAELGTEVLPEKTNSSSAASHGIIGKTREIQNVLAQVQLVAPTDTSVLITGESGTGKERIAEYIHAQSGRRNHPLIKVNCGSLPATLIESLLFGHEKGAFTGALERKIGKFEQANSGTVFLDEVGELPLEVQVKLLRVLQEREIERLGGSQTLNIDVRIIAATNRNMEKEVAEGRFRMDLYYRLHVFPIVLPPLRDRKEDIPLIAEHFIKVFSIEMGKEIQPLSASLSRELMNYHWPGNVRELGNTIERAVLMATSSLIKEIEITPSQVIQPVIAEDKNKMKTLEQMEREHIIAALIHCQGKISGSGGAANMLGLNPSTLISKMKKLKVEKEKIFFPKPTEVTKDKW